MTQEEFDKLSPNDKQRETEKDAAAGIFYSQERAKGTAGNERQRELEKGLPGTVGDETKKTDGTTNAPPPPTPWQNLMDRNAEQAKPLPADRKPTDKPMPDDRKEGARQDLEKQINLLIRSVGDLRAKVATLEGKTRGRESGFNPLFPFFFAQEGDTALQFTELAAKSGALVDSVGGRKCTDDADGMALITLESDQFLVGLLPDPTDGKMRAVKVSGGATTSRNVLVYITANRTCGGAYKGYIVSDLPSLMESGGFASGGATFTLDDILASASDIAGDLTDAEEITVLNDDEEGQTTHALTAGTQIKHLVLAFDSYNTDDDNSDCRIFIIGDSDNKECEGSGDLSGGF